MLSASPGSHGLEMRTQIHVFRPARHHDDQLRSTICMQSHSEGRQYESKCGIQLCSSDFGHLPIWPEQRPWVRHKLLANNVYDFTRTRHAIATQRPCALGLLLQTLHPRADPLIMLGPSSGCRRSLLVICIAGKMDTSRHPGDQNVDIISRARQ